MASRSNKYETPDSDLQEIVSPSPSAPNDNMLKAAEKHEELSDGRVILGRGSEISYVTRYRILKEKQRELIHEDIMTDLAPYCYASKRASCPQTVWQFVKSEPFLLSLHLVALLFSVMKRTMHDVEIDEKLELVHSCLETIVAVTYLVIRMAAGREKFHAEKVVRKEMEHCPSSVRTLTLKRAMWVFYGVGCSLIIFLLAALGAFVALDKLHWTIVTTNFALIIGGIGGNLTIQRLQGMVSNIIEDQHKAIIYESILLLRDSASDPRKPGLVDRIKRFTECVDNTDLFKNKGHINYEGGDHQSFATNSDIDAMVILQTPL